MHLHEIADEQIIEESPAHGFHEGLLGRIEANAACRWGPCCNRIEIEAAGFAADRHLDEIDIFADQLELAEEALDDAPFFRLQGRLPIVIAGLVADLRSIPARMFGDVRSDRAAGDIHRHERLDQADIGPAPMLAHIVP